MAMMPKLDELRAIQNNCGEFLLRLEEQEKTRTGIPSLKVEYNRLHGFYIEVTHAHSDKVPSDYRRRQTLKNAERYITPELKAFEDKALSAQGHALEREKFLYGELLDTLAPYIAICRGWRRALRNWMFLRHLPNARLRSITPCRCLLMKQLLKLRRAVIR